jgi:hypothetical protein
MRHPVEKHLAATRTPRSALTLSLVFGGVALAGVTVSASCSSATTDPHHDCLMLVGSTMSETLGAASEDDTPLSCDYTSDGTNALLRFQGEGPSGDETFWYFYFSGAPASGVYTLTVSAIGTSGYLDGSATRDAALATLAGGGAATGTFMVALEQVSITAGVPTMEYESAAGDSGSVTVGSSGQWPNSIGTSAATAFTFEAVPLHVTSRTGSGSGTGTAKVTGKLKTFLGVSNDLKLCSGLPDQVAQCVDLQVKGKCTAAGVLPAVTCACGAQCNSLGVCCQPNGNPCGQASECCNAFCDQSGKCGVPPADNGCSPDAGSTGSGSSGTCDTSGATYGPCKHTSDCTSQGYQACCTYGGDCSCAVCATSVGVFSANSNPCDQGEHTCP